MAPISDGALVERRRCCDDVCEGPGACRHAVVGGRNHLDGCAAAIEQDPEHSIQGPVLGQLRHHQTRQFIADDEIVSTGCHGQRRVSLLEEFGDDTDPLGTVTLRQLVERHERQQRCGVGFLG